MRVLYATSRAAIPLAAALLLAAPAMAAPPPNDDWANRIAISPAQLGAGFGNSQAAIAEATVEATDPLLVCKNGDPAQRGNTVWYSMDLSGASAPVYLNAAALGYDSVVAVFTGAPGAFVPVTGACNDDGAANLAARFQGVRLPAGSLYSIVVARPAPSLNAATLTFSAMAAPQYVVSKPEDSLDGSCNADCSLREAVAASNAAAGVILLPAGTYTLSLAGSDNTNTAGDLDLSTGSAVYGAGAANTRIVGMSGERVFDLEPANPGNIGSTFNFGDLAIAGGGGIGPGAGINAANGNDHLALRAVLIENNVSTLLPGGGVHSSGPSVVDACTIRNNSSAGNGGGLAFTGTAVVIRLDVFGSTVADNQSLSSASGGGGGIYAASNLFLYNSTVSGNAARFSGGGVLSTTFNGRANLFNVTLASNRADSDNNASGTGGGLRVEGSGAQSLNSAFAGNRAGTSGDDCSRTAALSFSTALGNHQETTGTATDCSFSVATNSSGPALLGPLAANGGSTQTAKPLPGSPLIDRGDAQNCLASDQRGGMRPVDGDANGSAVCDIGAVELTTAEADALLRDGFE